MNLKINDILNSTNGKLIIGNKDKECENYSTDTRTLKQGDVYIGIKGEKIDGSLLWKDAFHNGASCAIINHIDLDAKDIEKYKKQGKCIIEVQDTIVALGKIAEFKRNLYKDKLKVVGVTGSVGKTSTKDIIANVLSKKYKTLKTEGNNNNNIGLPLTILRLKDEEVAVIEMGMNHLGEISYLTKIAKPDISVITNIGTSHIGNLGSRENILKAKLEILDGMEKKVLVINNDNDLLNKWNIEQRDEQIEVHTFGIENKSEEIAENIILDEKSSSFICKANNEEFKITVPVNGKHFILNSLCAVTVGKLLNLSNDQIISGIESFKLTAKRMEIINLKNDITLINDSYNASYESMKEALSSLNNMKAKRKIAVLGDMLELGNFSEKLHREVGEEVYKNNLDCLLIVGNQAKYIAEGAIDKGFNKDKINCFNNNDELLDYLKQNINNGDTLLFKASNAIKLFQVAENLKLYIEKK